MDSKTTGKSGYLPVCENEWADGICDKNAFKCSVCPNRKLLPLSDKAIYNHLAGKDEYGRDVIGIYPMLPDDTCRFLCADFDEAEFEKDVAAYRSVCEEFHLPVAVERSRSGKGAHIWIFFDKPIPAATARQFGFALLDKGAESVNLKSFRYYDRMIPAQDVLPEGGLGNVIALPLQGRALQAGNSAFIDENWNAYPDQLQILWKTEALSPGFVEDCIKNWKEERGFLRDTCFLFRHWSRART